MADYVMAVTFNNVNQDDCRIEPNVEADWNVGQGNTVAEFSCEGWDPALSEGDDGGDGWVNFGQYAYPQQTAGHDWLGQFCLDYGTVDNRGNEVDWMRFFWDLDTKEAVPFRAIVQNYAESYPPEWNAGDTGAGGDDPRVRLQDAFETVDAGNPQDADYTDEWDNQAAYDGVQR